MEQNLLIAIPILGAVYNIIIQFSRSYYILEEVVAKIIAGVFISWCAAESFTTLAYTPGLPTGTIVVGSITTFLFVFTFFTIAHV